MENFDFINATPPNSLDAEQSVLGRLLTDPDAICEVIDFLKPEHFYAGQHQVIYQACCELFKANKQVDVISVPQWLKANSLDAKAGDASYIRNLAISFLEVGFDLKEQAKTIKDLAIRRDLIIAGYNLVSASYQLEASQALDFGQKELMSLQNESENAEEKSTQEFLEMALESTRARLMGLPGVNGYSTGFKSIDRLVSGLKKSDLIILAARPSMGKTALALNICSNVALSENVPVLFFSLEMSGSSIAERLISSDCESSSQLDKFQASANKFAESKLEIIDRAMITLPQIRALMRRKLNQYGSIGLVVIDYLQLIHDKGENRVQEVSNISRGLKSLAKEFDVPILCLSQLSRSVESRQDKVPVLSDLRESGAIEQDADIVMFIYRDEYYNKESNKPGIADIIVSKQRNGAVGNAELLFRAGITKFLEPVRNAY